MFFDTTSVPKNPAWMQGFAGLFWEGFFEGP
jgi:hypothetical protein